MLIDFHSQQSIALWLVTNSVIVVNEFISKEWNMKTPSVFLFIKKPIVQVTVIVLVFIAWMQSGSSAADPVADKSANQESAKVLPKVRVQQFAAELVSRNITLYGRTAADRETKLGAEWAGRVAAVFATRGSYVKRGDVIAKLDINDLPQKIARAKALQEQRNIEFVGAKKLASQGFQGRALLAAAAAALSDAEASLFSLELQLERTTIVAPISGILNERHVEVGDYLGVGDPIATIADIDPMIVRADVTETDIAAVKLDQQADIRLVSGAMVKGKVRYISRVADTETNTFRIEVAVPNADLKLAVGGSAEVALPLQQEWAIKLSPATLALNDMGVIGVKTVVDEHVVFTPIDILKADGDGSWLTGLGENPTVITVGQGFVRAGDKVDAVLARKK